MSAEAEPRLTIGELAAAAGMTVRNVRNHRRARAARRRRRWSRAPATTAPSTSSG